MQIASLLGFAAGASQVHHRLVGSERLRALSFPARLELSVLSVGVENPCLAMIAQADIKELPKLRLGAMGEYRRDYLDALGEVAVHPVSRPDEEVSVDVVSMTV